jgi:hypothetical protein
MGKKKNKEIEKLAILHCKKDMIIYGRNPDCVTPDTCYKEGKDYFFIVDEKNGTLFNINEVKQVHFLHAPDIIDKCDFGDGYTNEYFDIVRVGRLEDFIFDDFTLFRLEKLNKERYNYED